MKMRTVLKAALGAMAAACAFAAAAQAPEGPKEAAIRKVLAERLPTLPRIDEVSRSPVAGLYEVRFNGASILYADDKGDFVIVNGAMIDTKTRTDLTEARIEKLLAVDFDKLPLKDSFAIKQGNGSRRMAVFVDPNCGYCRRFERDLAALKDVTIHTFLLPILGPDSTAKSRDVWCAKDPAQSWRGLMLEGKAPAKAEGKCDTSVLERNVEFAGRHRVNGTPAVFFSDGTRKAGALPGDQVEKLLAAAAVAAKK